MKPLAQAPPAEPVATGRSVKPLRVLKIAWPLAALAVFMVLPFGALNGFSFDLFYFTFMYAAMSVGWNILGGYAGYISLAHLGFFGFGSYAAGLALFHFGWSIFITAPLVGLLCSVLAAGLGWTALRTRGSAFVIVTLAFTSIVQFLALNLKGLTGGSAGLYLPLVNLPSSVLPVPFYYYMLGLLVLAVLVSLGIRRSRFGLALIAIREDEGKAEGSGINTSLFKIIAFMISIWFAGVAGAIHAQYLDYVDPDLAFELIIMLNMIVMTLLGSRGTTWGPVLGAFILFPLSEYLVFWLPTGIAGQFHLALLGVVLVVVARYLPGGLLITIRDFILRRRGPGEPSQGLPALALAGGGGPAGPAAGEAGR
ncbi:MAG: branched-chain amino acid ABC transporter permease [Candidatus Dormibacteraceae bacterium]